MDFVFFSAIQQEVAEVVSYFFHYPMKSQRVKLEFQGETQKKLIQNYPTI